MTKHQRVLSVGGLGESGLPGVFFMYEMSPMMVKYTEKHRYVKVLRSSLTKIKFYIVSMLYLET